MSLLKNLVEMGAGGAGGAGGAATGGGAVGATGANAIAGFRAPVGKPTTTKRKKRVQNIVGEGPANSLRMIRRLTKEGSLFAGGVIRYERVQKRSFKALQRAMNFVAEDITGSTDFDAADVVSKLDAAEKKAKLEKDTTTFGLENENGNIVRVYVRADQADEFEQALAQMLSQSDSNNDKENNSMEIAEVLFKLKDKFDIVDVNWGDIPEDEENQEQQVGGEMGGAGGGAMPAQGGAAGGGIGAAPGGEENPIDQAAEEGGEGEGEGEEGEGEGEGEMTAGGDEGEARSALQSVIDMMKADAKAKQAEAEARAAEARAKEAEWAAKAAAAKVKQEEEVLDMETHEKQEKEMEKEAKRLAKLAKYRHSKATKYQDELGGYTEEGGEESEEEEQGGNRFPYDPADVYGPTNTRPQQKKVSLKQLRDMIYAHLRGDTP